MAFIKRLFIHREPTDRERKNLDILDLIRKKGPIARSDLSKLTGNNIVTVSNYIDHYIKDGLVTEGGYDTSTGGRKPMLVDMNREFGYAIGVGFDMFGILGVIVDLRSNTLFQVRKNRPAHTGRELIERIVETVEDILAKSSLNKDKIKGIGLAVAGIIDNENRTIRWPGSLGTQDTVISASLWDVFEKKFSLPILVENDADCAVFGEQWIAMTPDFKDVIYMYSGVSCGLMVGGRIYKGASGCAGELGILNPKMLKKYDLQREAYGLGRWNMELSMLDDLPKLQKKHGDSKIFQLVQGKVEDVTFLTLLEAAKAGDELAIEIMKKGGEALGKKVAFLVNLLNPQAVVIGGGIEKAGPFILDSLRQTVKDWSFEEVTRSLKIIPAQLGENAVPLGAASLVVQHMFAQM